VGSGAERRNAVAEILFGRFKRLILLENHYANVTPWAANRPGKDSSAK
jgi:hypothetical protein